MKKCRIHQKKINEKKKQFKIWKLTQQYKKGKYEVRFT